MQTLILAGGLGTRMRPLTTSVPKALIEVLGRPFASWQLDLLRQQGVTDVVYSVGHLGEQIEQFVGDGSAWGLSVVYSYECQGLLGTGGAIRLASDRGLLDDTLFVLYGDSYLTISFRAVEACFFRSGLPALMSVYRNENLWDRSNARYSNGLVTLYEKDSTRPDGDMSFVDYGLSVLTNELVRDSIESGVVSDLADLFHALSISSRLAGFEADRRFFEIGSAHGLADLEAHLSGR